MLNAMDQAHRCRTPAARDARLPIQARVLFVQLRLRQASRQRRPFGRRRTPGLCVHMYGGAKSAPCTSG
jgi:hypothetical protein